MKSIVRHLCWMLPTALVLLTMVGIGAAPTVPTDPPDERAQDLFNFRPFKEPAEGDEIGKLLMARYEEARSELKALSDESTGGRGQVSRQFAAGERVLRAGLDLCRDAKEKQALLTQYLNWALGVEKRIEARFQAGAVAAAERHLARYQRLEAELRLRKVKQEEGK